MDVTIDAFSGVNFGDRKNQLVEFGFKETRAQENLLNLSNSKYSPYRGIRRGCDE